MLPSLSLVWSPQWPCGLMAICAIGPLSVTFSSQSDNSQCLRAPLAGEQGFKICQVSYCAIRSKHWHERYWR